MFFQSIRRTKIEIEDLKACHRIEMKEKEAELERTKRDLLQAHELKLREVTSLLKLESEQKTKQLALDYQKRELEIKENAAKQISDFRESELVKNYDKLSSSLSKLHEEGNTTTKFMQELALKTFESGPVTRKETKKIKVISSGDK